MAKGLGRPNRCLTLQNLSSPGETDPSRTGEKRGLFWMKKLFWGQKMSKRETKNLKKQFLFEEKTPEFDPRHYGLGHLHRQSHSHSPENGFSKRGLPHFPGIFQGAKISDTKNSEIIVCATTNLSRPGEIILHIFLAPGLPDCSLLLAQYHTFTRYLNQVTVDQPTQDINLRAVLLLLTHT